jgi:methylase of polypeptide subunit release factors
LTNSDVLDIYDTRPAEELAARHSSLCYPYHFTFGGAQLSVDDGVFCPTLTKASPLLLSAVEFLPEQRVLDVFAGCGAFGIVAALRGANAVTVDISAKAVSCTHRNAARNGVVERIEARVGTVRDSVAPHEEFDVVVANPPLLPGKPRGKLGAAIFDPGLRATVELVNLLPRLLAADGVCFLLTSDVADRHGVDIEGICVGLGLGHVLVDKADHGYESYRVHSIRRLNISM